MIPQEIRDIPQWVAWTTKTRDGKTTKVPVSWEGYPVDITNPDNYRTFPDKEDKRGFVFTEGDPYCGIDLDNCLGPDGQIEPWAQQIVDDLDSYTEWSQSGNGLHIIVKAKLPRSIRKGRIEMYDHDRFFAITGELYNPYQTEIQDRQREVDSLFASLSPPAEIKEPVKTDGNDLEDENIIQIAMRAKNGLDFRRLWEGDMAGFEDDSEDGFNHSSADLALCAHLAFYTGNDAEAIDRLFRRSGLYRSKWERKDYRDSTIRKSFTADTFTPRSKEPDRPDLLGEHDEIAWETVSDSRLIYDDTIQSIWQYGAEKECKGVWINIGRDQAVLDRLVAPRIVKRGKPPKINYLNEVGRAIKRLAVRPEGFGKLSNQLVFKDCVVDLDDDFRELPHKENLYATRYLNVSWNNVPDMDEDTMSFCPNFDRLIEHGLNKPNVSTVEYELRRKALLQMIGYCLLPHNDLQKFHLIQGKTRNGKSVLTSLLQEMIPDRFRTSETLSGLEEKFALFSLFGKQLCICSESDTNSKKGEDKLKRITGGDTVQIEEKNKNSFEAKLPIHFVLVCNAKPRFYDPSGATHKRLELILWEGDTIPEEDRDHQLLEKIKPEIPYIVRMALAEIVDVLETKAWARSPMTNAKLSEFERWCNPVLSFVSEKCVIGDRNSINKRDLYDSFETYCNQNGYEFHKKMPSFVQVLDEHYGVVEERTSRERGVLKGIRMAEHYEVN